MQRPLALVLVPTKELAEQVAHVFEQMTTYCDKLVKVINLTAGSEQVQRLYRLKFKLNVEPNSLKIPKSSSLLPLVFFTMSIPRNFH